MPDPVLIGEAVAAAALTAAAVFLLCAWPWRSARPARASAGGVLGVGFGLVAGWWWLGLRFHWPPQEDQDRFLFLLFPAVVGVELIAAFLGRSRWLVLLMRLGIALAAARILLHNTSYITDLAGPATREWTPAQTALILPGLAAALAGVWAGLALLMRRTPGRSVPLTVALACGGAAATVMFSGYASGGQVGLALAGALAGAVVASLVRSGPPDLSGVLGLGVVGLFALLVMGHFFGQLTTSNAVLLFFGPLLGWVPELPYVRRVGPRLRGLARVILVAVPVVVALTTAREKFDEDLRRISPPGAREPTSQDYMDYGK